MKRRHFLATTIPFAAVAFTLAANEPLTRDERNLSFRNEIKDSLDRGLAWLGAQQNADGSFGKDTLHPALAALPLVAFQREPSGRFAKEDFLTKGYAYLRGFAQPDGGIYSRESGLANYNTSVCLLALDGANEPKDLDTLLKARAYVVGQQAGGMAKPETDGGIAYGSVGTSAKRGHPDLDNTVVALEALRATRHLVSDRPGTKDLNWNAAIEFVSRCQNLPSNKQPWASGDADNKGGFVYYPGYSNAGEVTLEGGGKALRSSGSMSYAGLLSFIYADVKKDDPRVAAAVEWLDKHYTLAENPGLEQQGYFYYLHLMAKGLTAAGITEIDTGGKKSDWRRDLAMRLMKLQQQDGSWANETPRWKENNPVLVTAYCALTLEILYAQL